MSGSNDSARHQGGIPQDIIDAYEQAKRACLSDQEQCILKCNAAIGAILRHLATITSVAAENVDLHEGGVSSVPRKNSDILQELEIRGHVPPHVYAAVTGIFEAHEALLSTDVRDSSSAHSSAGWCSHQLSAVMQWLTTRAAPRVKGFARQLGTFSNGTEPSQQLAGSTVGSPEELMEAHKVYRELGIGLNELKALAAELGIAIKCAVDKLPPSHVEAIRRAHRGTCVPAHRVYMELGVSLKALREKCVEIGIKIEGAGYALTPNEVERIKFLFQKGSPAESPATPIDARDAMPSFASLRVPKNINEACRQAVALEETDASACVAKCFTAIEQLLRLCAKNAGVPLTNERNGRLQDRTALEMTNDLQAHKVINPHVADLIHRIRKARNTASHHNRADRNTAKRSLSDLEEVYLWFDSQAAGGQGM